MPQNMRYIRNSERVVGDDFYLTMANLTGHGLSFKEALVSIKCV